MNHFFSKVAQLFFLSREEKAIGRVPLLGEERKPKKIKK